MLLRLRLFEPSPTVLAFGRDVNKTFIDLYIPADEYLNMYEKQIESTVELSGIQIVRRPVEQQLVVLIPMEALVDIKKLHRNNDLFLSPEAAWFNKYKFIALVSIPIYGGTNARTNVQIGTVYSCVEIKASRTVEEAEYGSLINLNNKIGRRIIESQYLINCMQAMNLNTSALMANFVPLFAPITIKGIVSSLYSAKKAL